MNCEECVYCEYFAPRECDFDSWCSKKKEKIKNLSQSEINDCCNYVEDLWK